MSTLTRSVSVIDLEQLEIQLDDLKEKTDAQRQQLRETEHDLRVTKNELRDTKKGLEEAQTSLTSLTERNHDLKLQVKEELGRNTRLETEIEGLIYLKGEMSDRNERIATLTHQLDEKENAIVHTRRALREEKENAKILRTKLEVATKFEDDLELARNEALTLKKLLVGKDRLLIQRTQELCAAQETLRSLQHTCDIPPRPASVQATYPIGAPLADPELRQWVYGAAQAYARNAHTSENKEQPPTISIDSLPYERGKKPKAASDTSPREQPRPPRRPLRNAFLTQADVVETQQRSDLQSNTSEDTLKDMGAAQEERGCNKDPNSYIRRTASRSKSPRDRSAFTTPNPDSPTNSPSFLASILSDEDSRSCPERASSAPTGRSVRICRSAGPRRIRTAVVRPRLQTTPTTSLHTTSTTAVADAATNFAYRRPSADSASKILNRLNYIDPRPPARKSRGKKNSAARGRDEVFQKVVHVGDRVVVDAAKKRARRKDFQTGLVKFIGRLDKSYDDYRLHVGLKLDNPGGDTDGLYQGKRYFSVPARHGKIVLSGRVLFLLDPKADTSAPYIPVADLMSRYIAESMEAADDDGDPSTAISPEPV